ncbi:MAG: lysophospholipid acyltransferase family protein [Bacteroidetes bacterium]|nr:lysophospholipid acyltransferase family protein [Bacteroidota bacterium]
MKVHWFYYVVRFLAQVGLKLFFGGVKFIDRDKIPKEGAIIFAPNHQGAFMDAMLVGAYSKRPVSFLTRADVFKNWAIPFLKSLNMMPIYRIRDGVQSLSQNDAVFQACFELLSEERAILIFPEGNHHIEYPLRTLSKGVARLALDARHQVSEDTKIYVIPTGINYFSHYRPLAKVQIKYGDPIRLEDYMGLYEEHKQRAYNQFRVDLSEAMKKTMILPDADENYGQKRDFIFQPKHENLPFEKLAAMNESNAVGIRKPKKLNAAQKFLVAVFSIMNLPPLLILKKVLSGIKDKVFYVSIKFLVGGILHILWWIVLYAIGAIWIGWEAGLLLAGAGLVMMYARQEIIKF